MSLSWYVPRVFLALAVLDSLWWTANWIIQGRVTLTAYIHDPSEASRRSVRWAFIADTLTCIALWAGWLIAKRTIGLG